MGYDWKIGAKKLVKNIVYCLVAGAAIIYADNPYYLALVPALKFVENLVTHWG